MSVLQKFDHKQQYLHFYSINHRFAGTCIWRTLRAFNTQLYWRSALILNSTFKRFTVLQVVVGIARAQQLLHFDPDSKTPLYPVTSSPLLLWYFTATIYSLLKIVAKQQHGIWLWSFRYGSPSVCHHPLTVAGTGEGTPFSYFRPTTQRISVTCSSSCLPRPSSRWASPIHSLSSDVTAFPGSSVTTKYKRTTTSRLNFIQQVPNSRIKYINIFDSGPHFGPHASITCIVQTILRK